MPLTPGARLGAYEVLSTIGAGGMGEVYRARDTRLKRDVAIKVLPDSFATDPDRLARFQREAELLASLNHPNIAAVYGLEEGPAEAGHYVRAIVLELIEGDTLADLIARGPLLMTAALPIARQVAEALEAAHEKGVIHRDLKPANIKVTPDGKVKVLDFGLATVVQPSTPQNINATHSPTLTLATQAGLIMGTAAYMSPEQASGAIADRRADVWAFGVVLWEMLTGERLFDGETVSHTLAYVLTKEPDWNAVPVTTPAPIRRLLRRCLEKDRKKRLADITSARMEIDDATTAVLSDAVAPSAPAAAPATRGRAWLWVMAIIAAAGLAVALTLWARSPQSSALRTTRLTADLGVGGALAYNAGAGASVAISPDGSIVAFVAFSSQSTAGGGAQSQLYVRRLDQLTATALAGTEDAHSPFFSPDGQWIAFFASGKLKKIARTGGATVTLCDAPNGRGGTWAEDGTIVFQPSPTPGADLMRVSESSGQPMVAIKAPSREASHRWPQMLPGGKTVLFTSGGPGYWDNANVVVQALSGGTPKIIMRGGYYAGYLRSGHVVYVHNATLFALPFDIERLEPTGPPVPVVSDLTATVGTGSAQFAASQNGTFVYHPGEASTYDAPIMWMGRDGVTTTLREMPSDWSSPRFSPDGKRLAVDIVGQSGVPAFWIYDWARDTATRLTFGNGLDISPSWTPDGRRILFSSTRDGPVPNLYWQRADGTGEVQRLTTSSFAQLNGTWHPSGKVYVFREQHAETGVDIMVLTIDGDEASGFKPGQPTPFLNTRFDEQSPRFSRDGRWLAYVSTKTGQPEVYVRPFPGAAGEWPVSNGGGLEPVWSQTREELFYLNASGDVMVAPYAIDGQSIRFDKPRRLSQRRVSARPRIASYDLHPDGTRFAVAALPAATEKAAEDKVVFVFDFFNELKRVAPAKE